MRFAFARAVLGRLALVVFGLLLSLLLLEGLLQAGAFFTHVTGYDTPIERVIGRRRVLCLGDSNTYGLHVERSQAYPEVLEKFWNAEVPKQAIEVLNLGVPGTNSSKLRSRFRQILRTFDPDIVLVMVGVNDSWTAPVPLAEETAGGDEREHRVYSLWQHSRVFRLLYMLHRALEAREVHVTVKWPEASSPGESTVRLGSEAIDLTWTGATPQFFDWQPALERNLTAMIDDAHDARAKLVLLTYPSERPDYAYANNVIRRTAKATQTPLIDLGAAFRELCPSHDCPELFLPDYHPTPKGYELAATVVMRDLVIE